MRFSQILLITIASISVISCATYFAKNVHSPSGRFEINYGKASLEQDAAYGILDHLNGAGYSICSGNDTPLNKSTFMWSPSELTFVILQGEHVGSSDRFVLVQNNSTTRQAWCLLNIKPLEERFFNGRSAKMVTVSDTSIGFRIGDSSEIRQIILDDLVNEAQRQQRE
jgi:hypothetical protein